MLEAQGNEAGPRDNSRLWWMAGGEWHPIGWQEQATSSILQDKACLTHNANYLIAGIELRSGIERVSFAPFPLVSFPPGTVSGHQRDDTMAPFLKNPGTLSKGPCRIGKETEGDDHQNGSERPVSVRQVLAVSLTHADSPLSSELKDRGRRINPLINTKAWANLPVPTPTSSQGWVKSANSGRGSRTISRTPRVAEPAEHDV